MKLFCDRFLDVKYDWMFDCWFDWLKGEEGEEEEDDDGEDNEKVEETGEDEKEIVLFSFTSHLFLLCKIEVILESMSILEAIVFETRSERFDGCWMKKKYRDSNNAKNSRIQLSILLYLIGRHYVNQMQREDNKDRKREKKERLEKRSIRARAPQGDKVSTLESKGDLSFQE